MENVSLEIKQLRDTLVHQRKNHLQIQFVAAALSGLCAAMPDAKTKELVEKAVEIGSAAAVAFSKNHKR